MFDLYINLLAALICWILGFLMKDTFIPFFKKITYKGIDLEGVWQTEGVKNTPSGRIEHKSKISISQYGINIKGTIEVDSIYSNGESENFKGEISGRCQTDLVIINYFRSDEKNLGIGTLLLRVFNNGKEITGFLSFQNRQNGDIENVPNIQFFRKI
jgi:hypothetical protein